MLDLSSIFQLLDFLFFIFYFIVADSTGSGSVLWKPVEATGQHMIHGGVTGGAECMQAEAGEESPNNTPSMNPLTISAARVRMIIE